MIHTSLLIIDMDFFNGQATFNIFLEILSLCATYVTVSVHVIKSGSGI